MFEKVKKYARENPDKFKKIGIAVGALLGLTVAGTALVVVSNHYSETFDSSQYLSNEDLSGTPWAKVEEAAQEAIASETK